MADYCTVRASALNHKLSTGNGHKFFPVRRHFANQHKIKSKRGFRSGKVFATTVPTEDPVLLTQPLTKEDLVLFFKDRCKPKQDWRIGTEHEKFGFNYGSLRPIRYEQIAQLMDGLSEQFKWKKVYEEDHIIGLKKDNCGISLEPGGQFELSGAPLQTLHETCAELNMHLYELKEVADKMGIGFMGAGFQPKWPIEEIPVMPIKRYQILREYMPTCGPLALDVMFGTCTVQVNLDFSSEKDMVKKFRVGLALQPVVTAIFANSPFKEGKPNGFLSYRSHGWTEIDNSRTGLLPFVFHDDFGFEKYVDFMLDVPLLVVYHKGRLINCTGMSFRDFLAGKLPVLPGVRATIKDWQLHLSSTYPEVRLKQCLEMRGADGGPWKRLVALPALWVGLLYDDESLDAAYNMIQNWTEAERSMLRKEVPRTGLMTPFRDGLLHHVAQDTFKLSKAGLERRGYKEVCFLNDVLDIVKDGKTPAEKLLQLYYTEWEEYIDPIFKELLY